MVDSFDPIFIAHFPVKIADLKVTRSDKSFKTSNKRTLCAKTNISIIDGFPDEETVKDIVFEQHDGKLSHQERVVGNVRRLFDGLIQGSREVDPLADE